MPRWISPALVLLVVLSACGTEEGAESVPPFARAVAHYAQVESELLSATPDELLPEQRAARARLIEELRAYRERREFTINDDFPGARIPYFVDDEGRHCAVAHLLHRFGRDELVARVAAEDNHAWVADLAGNAEFDEWLDEVGLTAAEAVRIQVPGRIPRGKEPPTGRTPPPEGPTGPGEKTGPKESPGTPGHTGEGTPPESPGPGEEASPGGAPDPAPVPVGPGGGSGPGGPPAPGGSAGGGSIGGSGGLRPGPRRRPANPAYVSWYLWWELNKLDYLRANPIRIETGPVTGEGSPSIPREILDRLADRHREAVLPRLLSLLEHEDGRIRSAAAIAAGRVGGESAVEALLGRLEDPQKWVRERAILALGATGSEAAADALLRIAEKGTHRKGSRDELSPSARPLAILGLALARRYGAETPFDARLAQLLKDTKKRDIVDIGVAGLLHGILSPGEKLDAAAIDLAMDRNAPDPLRARATERLAALKGPDALRPLQDALAGSRLELRRSAAVALGGVDHELVLPRLMTAFELESEPLARGLLLLSIGERGGEEATRFLARQIREGPTTLRPWAALGLGLLARAGDRAALEALRETTLPVADQGAVWLARGIARDAAAVPALTEALAEYGSPRDRGHAATALALIGGERARHALLTRMFEENSPAVKAVIAQCIGILGDDEDTDLLIRALRASSRPEHSGVVAVGLGFHGGAGTLAALREILDEEDVDPMVRATAVKAIGLLLDRRPGLEFPALSRRTNFAAAPDWLYPVLLTTL